jgi:serine O-acetyltransferase
MENIIKIECRIYKEYMFNSKSRFIFSRIKREPVRMIWIWQYYSRKTDYYKQKAGVFAKLLYLFFICLRNRLGEKLCLEISTENIAPGLLIYHYNNVVNGGSVIGRNCRLHGNNCIGNAGPHDLRCPVIGDNVMLGVGAKVIGNVTIADDVKIAAGAVVVTSFTEKGITIGGVPARKLK